MSRGATLRRFFKAPKGQLILILAALVLIALAAAPDEDLNHALPGLLSAVIVSGILDAIVLGRMRPRWEFPSGAVLSALIVAMVLSAEEPGWVVTLTSVVAIFSKYLFRSRAGNVFNPAALAIVATFPLFDTGQSWWGALPGAAPWAQVGLVMAGLFVTSRVDRIPLLLSFMGAYFGLFTVAAFLGDPGRVAGVFRSPDLEAVLFFAFFMLTDPPTAPVKYPDQIVFGVIVASVAFAVFERNGAVYYLPAGLLAGNFWEAWRRVSRRAGHTFPRGTSAFVREISPWRSPSLCGAAQGLIPGRRLLPTSRAGR